MRSKIYEGFLKHVRTKPVHHRLVYPLYFYAIDLDELPLMDESLPLFGYNRVRPVSIFDCDYLDGPEGSIRDKLMRFLDTEGLASGVSRVCLITQPRYFTSVFNPVSFYYCYGAGGGLECVVTEVNNTFGERHVYVLKDAQDPAKGFPAVFKTAKSFHVSPFNDVSGEYLMSFSEIGDEAKIQVDLLREGEKVFTAQFLGRARPLTTVGQIATILRHPLTPWLTMSRIYREAAKLFFLRKLAYHPKPVPTSPMTIRRSPPSMFQRIIASVMERLLHHVERGRLEVVLPDNRTTVYGKEDPPRRAGRILVSDWGFFTRVAFDGEVGLGESYMEGLWDSDDLTGALELLIENRGSLRGGNICLSAVSRARNFRIHRRRPNTIPGSRKNIADHYDLSAEFYRTFLDDTMTYSCAVFRSPEESLEEAQRNKMRAVIEKAGINRADHVLEIGCGWGGFAVEAVKATGCRLTGITVSKAQFDHARARVQAEGLADRIEIRLEDYRTVEGRYDRIVSIEMLEAVGHEYLGGFFAHCDRLLAPEGLAVLQVITIPDARYETHRTQPNWIQKHIFPGGVLPSLTALCDAMTGHSRLLVESVENIGIHYAETLKRWRERFIAAQDAVVRMGFDRASRRKWIYYFSLCEAQFALRVLNDLQIVLTREGNRSLQGAWQPQTSGQGAG